MKRYQVLLTDYAWPDLIIERETLAEADADLIVADATDEATLVRQAADADAIMTNWAKVTSQVLAAAVKCRIVARTGIGLDNIDVEFATARKIPVTNVPDYCIHEVAEHALALILALGRKVAFYHQQTKSGRYQIAADPPLRRLKGQTLGIVGLGNTGRQLAAMASAIGLRVLAYARQPERVRPPAEWAPLDMLLTQSDYVSLHLASTPETRRLIGREQLGRMKPTAYLINTARGAVLDEEALAEALATDRLAGAALDVQEQEPPDLARPPYNDSRVIVTPHVAFYSLEAVNELRRRASRQVADALIGKSPAHVVNGVEVLRPKAKNSKCKIQNRGNGAL